MEMSILVASKVTFVMVTESLHGQVEQYMRVIGLMEICQEKERSHGHQEISMRVNSIRIFSMVKALKLGRMDVSILEIGKKVKKEGRGTIKWANGSVFDGFWSNELRMYGVYRFANGDDIYRFANGDVYIGNFKNNLLHGNGKCTWSNGTIYEGDWVDGEMSGKGEVTWPSGTKYDGEFYKNFSHGKGTITWKDGCIYTGNWEKGKKEGGGIMKWANGSVLDGFWSNGLKRSGVYRFANGDVYKGEFKSDIFNGIGEYRCSNGTIYMGYWENGKMTKIIWKINDPQNIVGVLYHDFSSTLIPDGLSFMTIKRKYKQGDVEKIRQDIMDKGENKSIVKQVNKSSPIWKFLKTFKSNLEFILQLCSSDQDNVKRSSH